MPDLDTDTAGRLTLAEFAHGEGKLRRAAEHLRDASDALYLKAEQTDGLLTADALADRVRREAVGRAAALAAESGGPSLQIVGQQPGGKNLSGCIRGVHSVGLARDANGHGTCTQCGTTIIAPDQGGQYDMSIRPLGSL